MKRHHSIYRRIAVPAGSMLLAFALCVAFGGLAAPASAAPQSLPPPIVTLAAASSVPVSQEPLTIRQPIPPNIVLMLDDSGSMRWDVMPDWPYLPAPNWGTLNSNWNHFNDAAMGPLLDSDFNGVYYNPTITYTPPPKADGTYYPNADFDAAMVNGFDTSATPTTVDLSLYRGFYDSNDVNYEASSVQYSIPVKTGSGAAYAPSSSCPSGWGTSGKYPGWCSKDSNPGMPYNFFDTNNHYYYVSRCNSISDVYAYNGSLSNDKCYPGISFFTYMTTGPSDTYIRHYVAKEAGDCAAAGLSSTVCDESAATQQNVANWFSYYHTRILLAKTGLMRAFTDLNPTYRVGFGSINNSASGYINTLDHTVKNGKYIANVKPFGLGGPGSQKANFWQWAADISPTGSTPLRLALQSVGMYYETNQPWQSQNPITGDTDYLACRQAYTILTTDGFWNGGSPGVGDNDDNAGTTVTGPNGNTFTYAPRAPFMDSASNSGFQSNTLADVAMKYWMTDLMSSIPNEVPTNNADPAFWQHMVSFTMGLGFTPSDAANNPITSATVQGLFDWVSSGTQPASLSSWGGWPVPSPDNGGSINNTADLVHAGVDGHGGFFSATSPQTFIEGLRTALQRAQERTGTGASLAANSTQLKTGTMAYQAIYHTAIWAGELKAYEVNPVTGQISVTVTWNAATAMPAPADRDIHTYVPGSGNWAAGSGSDVAFVNSGATPPALTAAQLSALGGTAADQVNIVNYLRGDDSLTQAQGGSYRNRVTPLGDIVDSQPVYVGGPDPNEFSGETFTGASTYDTFASDNAGRNGLIYVAANDGMLHAFDVTTGKEVYAFLPGSVITNGGVDGAGNVVGVSELANPDYGTDSFPHQYFNDGQLTVADAYFGAVWHTVLVGTTGRGLAKTIYALDVTDPTNITLLWERSAGDGGTNSNYIGQITGKPVIAQVADGQWAVLMGNGYNSAAGVSALLQFNLADGTLSVHPTTDTTTGNGLAGTGIWIGDPGSGVSTTAYAGDLHGQVWLFTLSTAVTDPVTHVTTITGTPTSTGSLLFTAKDAGGNIQPITSGMLVGRDPDTNDLWVFFGTGRYLSGDDITDTSVQTWYGLIVDAPTEPALVTNLVNGRSALAKRAIIAQTAGSSTTNPDGTTTVVLPARVVSPPGDPNTPSIAGKSGWYMDLQSPIMDGAGNVTGYTSVGERIVAPDQFEGSRLIATTRIPNSDDPCNPSGTGWVMAVNPFTGTNPQPQFFDLNGDGTINSADMVTVGGTSYAAAGVGFNSLPNSPIFVGNAMLTSFDNGTTSSIMTSGAGNNLKRVSWREMVNQ